MTTQLDSRSHRPAPEIELAGSTGRHGDRGVGHLGPLLAWAVVFADLGTSVFYVPGILYAQVGGLAPAFVLVATVAFVFVALEHLEIAHRYPEGGGGVAAAVQAFGPRVAVVSGALMISAYLLTINITVVSALNYVAALRPWPHEVPVLSGVAILVLGYLNWIGMRELARVALVLGLAMLVVEAALIATVIVQLRPSDWADLWGNLGHVKRLSWSDAMTGFAGAWLAYSGLESLGQMAPAVRAPRRRVIRIATALILITVVATVPLFTALAVEAASASHIAPQGALLAPVALKYGGRDVWVALTITGAGLLFVAANLSFIGCYNVYKAVGEHGYLPAVLARRSPRYGTPRGAIVAITAGALAIVVSTRADLLHLGRIFAFGLLGSYAITSVSLDVVRWREGRRGIVFATGLVATAALVIPWVTSWFTKPDATLYGAAVTALQLCGALVAKKGWVRSGRFGFLRAEVAERVASDQPSCGEVVTLAEAVALKQAYPSTTLLALRAPNPSLCAEAARRARGVGDAAVYVVYVDEIPGLFFPPRTGPSDLALDVLDAAVSDLGQHGVEAVPIWRIAHDAGASIAEAAEELGASCVMVGTTTRTAVGQFLRGDVLKELVAELPEPIHVVICG
jgi:amino acid transporter